MQRIGRYSAGKQRSLRVRVKTLEARNEILKRAGSLKETNSFTRVFIAPDLTRAQQVIDKELRDRVKKFKEEGQTGVRIKAGKIIKNIEGGQVQILYQP